MLIFPFGADTKFTIIPKIGGIDIPRAEMIDLRIRIENKNRGVDFEPIWSWNEAGIEIEIQKEKISIAATYFVVLSWKKQNDSYSGGYKNYTGVRTVIAFEKTNCDHGGEAVEIIVSPEFQGEKGKPFKLEDFTEEQLDGLSLPVAETLEEKLTENWIKKDF